MKHKRFTDQKIVPKRGGPSPVQHANVCFWEGEVVYALTGPQSSPSTGGLQTAALCPKAVFCPKGQSCVAIDTKKYNVIRYVSQNIKLCKSRSLDIFAKIFR
jgi:hypothetical protein